jgi:8-hydroxy-5-deazaflavin:NADPH oxidoreductase
VSKFGILGSGTVGQTLAAGLKKKGHEVRIGSRDPEKLKQFASASGIEAGTFAAVAQWAEHLVLAVKGTAAQQALGQAGRDAIRGKAVIDTTNPMAEGPPEDGVTRFFTGPNSSLMEQLQTAFPDAHFVKAFNSVGAGLMVDPAFGGVKPTMFYCGNDAGAKSITARVIEQLGWVPADMGTVRAARAIEPLYQLWCIPGFLQNRWTDHALHLLRR